MAVKRHLKKRAEVAARRLAAVAPDEDDEVVYLPKVVQPGLLGLEAGTRAGR